MPLYEYQCGKCAHRFETIRKVSDPPPDGCPKCGGTLHKLQSAPAFHLKGAGWYITDYARKGEGSKTEGSDASKDSGTSESKGSSESKGGSESKDGSKTESKDAAKGESKEGTKTDAKTAVSAAPKSGTAAT